MRIGIYARIVFYVVVVPGSIPRHFKNLPEEDKDKETIQSSTISDPGHHMGN